MARSPLRALVRLAVVVLALLPLAVAAQTPGPRPAGPVGQPAAEGGTIAGPLPAPARPGTPMLALTWEEESVQAGASVGLTLQALDGAGNADAGPAGSVTLYLDDDFAAVTGGGQGGGALDTAPVAGGRKAEVALAGGTGEARVRFSRPGAHVVRAELAGTPPLAGESDALLVRPTFLRIEGPSSASAGRQERYTVTAVDEQGQAVADYEGTLAVTTDGAGEPQPTASPGASPSPSPSATPRPSPTASPSPSPGASPASSAVPTPSPAQGQGQPIPRPRGDGQARVVVTGSQRGAGASESRGEAVQPLARGGGGRLELEVTFSAGGEQALAVRDLEAPRQRATLPVSVADAAPGASPSPSAAGSPRPSGSPGPSASPSPVASAPPLPTPSPPAPPRPFGVSTSPSPTATPSATPRPSPTPIPSGTPAPAPSATASPSASASPVPTPSLLPSTVPAAVAATATPSPSPSSLDVGNPDGPAPPRRGL